MKTPALTISKASIGYRHGRNAVPVVENVDAALYGGELVALVGRNGEGKSTLLRTLSAFQPPLSGVVECSGKNITELSVADVAKEIAMVFSTAEPAPLAVREIVTLGRTPYTNFIGRMTAKDHAVVDRAMEMMGVTHLAGRALGTLSDGERQKCMIAKALAQETPLILLDEPTAFLDFGSKVALFRMLAGLAKDAGKAVLVSTHDVELALRFADRLWLLSGGVLSAGTTGEIAGSGIFRAFIGDDGIRYDKKEKRIDIL